MSESDEPEKRGGTVTAMVCQGSTETVHEACLARADGCAPDTHVLAVTTSKSADAFVDEWIAHRDRTPADLVVFELGQSMRSTTGRSSTAGPEGGRSVAVASGDSGETDGVTAVVADLVDEWRDAAETPVVYLDSLSELLYTAGLAGTVDWLDGLGEELAANGWRVLARIDGGRHDPRTLGLLGPVVDSVLELVVDGEQWSWVGRDGLLDDETKLKGESGPETDDVFDSLRTSHRRHVLQLLGRTNRPLTVGEIVEYVVETEYGGNGEPTETERSRVFTGLHHVHLPKLDRLGLISYDDATHTVVREPAARRVEPELLLSVFQ